jgi:hypothetical protein
MDDAPHAPHRAATGAIALGSVEHEVPILAVGQAFCLQPARRGRRVRHATGAIGAAGDRERRARESPPLRGVEPARARIGRQPRDEQDLAAQVVADAGEEPLVEQQRAEGAAGEARLGQRRFHGGERRTRREQLDAEPGDIGMRREPRGGQHRDLRRAVEQRRVIAGLDRQPQVARRLGPLARRADQPFAVELVVRIDAAATREMQDQRLAARLDAADATPG